MSLKVNVEEEVMLPKQFQAAGHYAGIKKRNAKDMALIYSEVPAAMAGTFTTNQVKAATVRLCMSRLKSRTGRAVIINSGNANACNGERGAKDAERMSELAAEVLGISKKYVYVCSTGHIGVPLPMTKIENGIRHIAPLLSTENGRVAAESIMTTDTKPKFGMVRMNIDGKPVTLSAICKGAGMIEPNMATMLCFIVTDAAVDPKALQQALTGAVNQSFNRITVDGDRSTNDTVLLFANGAAGNKTLTSAHKNWSLFCNALNALTHNLALKIVRDGEGATKLITVHVKNARSDKDADIAARSVANSFLVKTAWHGDFPNWGRIMDALGYSDAKIVENKVDMFYDKTQAVKKGVATGVPLGDLKKIQLQSEFTVTVDLHLGKGKALVYTCDCSEEYVTVNA